MIELQNSAPRCIGPYCAQAPVQAMNGNGMNGMNSWMGSGSAYNRAAVSGNGGYGGNGYNGNNYNGNGYNGNGYNGNGTAMRGNGNEQDMDITPGNGMTNAPQEDFDEPLTADEAARSSWRALLARNVGRSVIVTFLMGTQNAVVVEGVLYEVGSDYLVIYQSAWESNITADLYSVKFVEFREPPGSRRPL
ncbi:MAG: hypothetical protein II379_05630 [Oscillospiraceae bacterium]|nr:hypothetical protein [Oscillospiraceae bacterium]